MSAVPGAVDTDAQPPMAVPLRHFVVALGFLLLGVALGLSTVLGVGPGAASLAHVHLLLVGWVCVTIAGAMTQFVPVWSGARLHSQRLATVQLWLVVAGLLGFVGGLLSGRYLWLPAAGVLLVAGFWTFAYNVGRTLLARPGFDVTERHFAFALVCFVLATALGLLLAIDLVRPVFGSLPVSRSAVIGAHATLAVFGAIVTTILGALYQLATMFTQTELRGVDVPLRRLETAGYPAGVTALAAGRLLESLLLARLGGIAVAAALAGFSVVLARRLLAAEVSWTPMLSRYAVATPGLALWALLAGRAWVEDPLAPAARFGAPGSAHLLALGVIGIVVVGTLYHVVPFLVWVHRYSDRLGLEPVPTIDDLYDGRVAAAELVLLAAGTVVLAAADWFGLATTVAAIGGALVLLATTLFVANLLWVVRRHSPRSLSSILVPAVAGVGRWSSTADDSPTAADDSLVATDDRSAAADDRPAPAEGRSTRPDDSSAADGAADHVER